MSDDHEPALSEGHDARSRSQRDTAQLFLAVVGSALAMLTLMVAVDVASGWDMANIGQGLGDALGSLAEVMVALLGVSMTVVAIVVQLASARYPAKIVDIFMTDRLNLAIFGFMSASCIYVVIAPALVGSAAPRVVSVVAITLVVTNIGLLLPYFGRVFAFLDPSSIITRIKVKAETALAALLRRTSPELDAVLLTQRQVANALERIADNSMAAVGQSDRDLATHTVRTLESFITHYLPLKSRLPPAWAQLPAGRLSTLAKEFTEEISADGTWVEAKVLMEYERIFRRSLGEMSELVSQVAASTHTIGAQALRQHDEKALNLSVQLFNTYMRHTLNARNVRAAYNVLYEYRQLATDMLRDNPSACVRVVKHLVYYGRTANAMNLPFITVTVAHDVRVLCEQAYDLSALDMNAILRLFLTLDQPSEDDGGEVALLGVRRAQSILGAFFLARGAEPFAEQIRHDMRDEPDTRLRRIRDEILMVEDRKFWEVTDRGFNFDWVPDELRPHIHAFFAPMLRTPKPAL